MSSWLLTSVHGFAGPGLLFVPFSVLTRNWTIRVLHRFDQPTRNGGELAVLQALTAALGPAVWLNTVIALTHAGALPPSSAKGPMDYEVYVQQRSHLLQLVIRAASGDARLMNPIAYVDSHPACKRNEQVRASQSLFSHCDVPILHIYLCSRM